MAKVKIRHGLAFYIDETNKDKPVQRTAFRTQVINVSNDEADRLKSIGAAVDADEELPRFGLLTPLPNTASDEELIAWVSVATKDEIADAVAERPNLKDRILNAADTIKKRLEAQQELLDGLQDTVDRGVKKGKARKPGSAPTTGLTGTNQVKSPHEEDLDPLDEEDDEEELDEDDPRSVVKGNVNEVSKWLSEHPDQASAVLEAENELADSQDRQPRDGVVKAVQAAAQTNA